MIEKLQAMVRKVLTERDNVTLCPVRIGGVGTGVIYHAAAAWMVFGQHTSIDMALLSQYIDHMIKLLGMSGLAIGVKSVMKADAPREDAQ